MGSGDEIQIYLIELARALQNNLPPPPIPPDMPPAAQSEIDALLAQLHLAANSGDPADNLNAQAGYAQRQAQTGDAMAKFPANEEQSSKTLQQVMGMAEQIPKSLSSVGQGFGGMFGNFFKTFTQMMQQGMQTGQQLAGTLAKGAQGAGLAGALPAEALGDTLGAGGGLLGAGAGAAGGLAATAPAGYLGPPATPSAATFPASSPPAPPPTPPAADASAGSWGAMGGYPMMPPAAMGAGGAGSDAKADTKRVVPPSVKNGAPVQGRITAPPTAPEVTKRVAGKPVASRRILIPDEKPADDDRGGGSER